MTANACNDLRNFFIGLIVHAMRFHAGALLPLLVADLPHIGIHLVDG